MAPHIAANTVTAEESSTAKQRVAGTFMKHILGQAVHGKALLLEPLLVVWHFGLAHLRAKPRTDERAAKHQAGVRREHHVWQTSYRVEQRDLGTQPNERVKQTLPLPNGTGLVRTAA